MTIARAGPFVLVTAVAVGAWLVGGVSPGDIAIFVLHEALFVIIPGWLLYRALTPRAESGLRQLVFGWALGYVLELCAFMLTAALGVRSLLMAYPEAVALVALLLWYPRRRQRRETRSRPDPRGPAWAWTVAVLCGLAIVWVAGMNFPHTPLPSSHQRITYEVDYAYHLSLAGDAKHHWPVGDPQVAGAPLAYHAFAHFDVAAISQVTGQDLSLVLFRLLPVPLVILLVLGMAYAGSELSRRSWVGPTAVLVLLLVGELDLDPHASRVFGNSLFEDVYFDSPSEMLGLALFIPTLVLLHERCSGRARLRTEWGRWLLLFLLLCGCGGAKGVILPVVLGGLCLYLPFRWLTVRRLESGPIMALAATLAAFALSYLLLYRGATSGAILHFPGAVMGMPWYGTLDPHLRRLPAVGKVSEIVAAVIGCIGFFGATLAGLIWAFKRRRPAAPAGHALLLAIFSASLVPFLALTAPGDNQILFLYYGLVAAGLLSAEGVCLLWAREVDGATGRAWAVARFGVAWLALMVLLAFVPSSLLDLSKNQLYVVRYGALAIGMGVLVILAIRAAWARRGGAWIYPVVALLITGAVNVPLDLASDPGRYRAQEGPPWGPGPAYRVRQGLFWLRNHTPTNAVVAVNNQYVLARSGDARAGKPLPLYFYYSAFSERRMFLEGWLFTNRANRAGEPDVAAGRKPPYPRRLRLNTAVFRRADRAALRVLTRDYGVDYLLVDKTAGGASPKLRRLGRVAFSNPDVAVYSVKAT